MALNVISNFAANVAQRHLAIADQQATDSVAKLSAGKRVLSAKDDAAALAIGSRLTAEVAGLRQANVNAGQASSMLQIADGSMGKVQDILTRMKTLSIQAGSDQLSDTERSMLDTEFQDLKSEIDRLAEDTDFNSTQLVAGSQSVAGAATGVAGVNNIAARGVTDTGAGSLKFMSASNSFTFTAAGGAKYTGALDGSSLTSPQSIILMATGTAQGEVIIQLTTGFSTGADATNALTVTGTDTQTLTFKVGTGVISSSDELSITLDSVSTTSLGIDNVDITTAGNADVASTAISSAIDVLQTSRSEVGAAQNRLDFASANLQVAEENQEAARSQLMDLDVATEITNFTSKQILVQAGTSMLAQANQLPQNLLSLFN